MTDPLLSEVRRIADLGKPADVSPAIQRVLVEYQHDEVHIQRRKDPHQGDRFSVTLLPSGVDGGEFDTVREALQSAISLLESEDEEETDSNLRYRVDPGASDSSEGL